MYLLSLSNRLNLETTRLTATTSLFELTSLGPDERLDTIVGVGVIDGSPLAKVRQGLTAGGPTQQDSVGSSGSLQGKLIEGKALSSSSNNTLASILREGKGAYTHLRAFEHANVVGDLSNNNSSLSVFVSHVLGETVKAEGRRVDLRHMQTLGNSSAELGVRSAGKEFV
jgi:hypothetical protein